MNKMKKRIWAYILALVTIVSLLPGAIFAAETTNPIDTEEELLAAIEADPYGTIKLGGNITVSEDIVLTYSGITLNLNGYNITGNDCESVFTVECANLCITGEGTIKNTNGAYAIKLLSDEFGIYNSRLEIKGGTFIGDNDDSTEGGAIYVDKGTIAIITGGTFKDSLVVDDGAKKVYISAGTFVENPEKYISNSAECKLENGAYVVTTTMSDEFKAILNKDGKFVMNSVVPKDEWDAIEFFCESEAMYEKYEGFYWSNFSDDFTECDISYNYNDELYMYEETHRVEIVYNYDEDVEAEMNDIMNNLPEPEESSIYFYAVKDMELVNWWVNSNEINHFIRYSGELKEYIKYKNFYIDCRAGDFAEFHTWAEGFAPLMCDDVLYGSITMGVRGNHIIYLPDNTGDTVEELIEAAQKRIDEYVGAGKVEISYGGQDIYKYFVDRYDADIAFYTEKVEATDAEIERLAGLMADCQTTMLECENTMNTASNKGMEYEDLKNQYLDLIMSDPDNATEHQAQVDYYQGLADAEAAKYSKASEEWDVAQSQYYEYMSLKEKCQIIDKEPNQNELDWAKDGKKRFIDGYNNEDGEFYYLQSAEGDYWFNMTIGDVEHMFIVAKDSDSMITPEYKSSDVKTDVTVSSTDTSIPLDTSINVEKLTSGDAYKNIIDLLGVEDNETFDIKLFSNSLDNYITKLANGKFQVKIPIGAIWKNKSLIVYYVDADKQIHEYEVNVAEGYAAFETDHFSVYTLAAKDEVGIEVENGKAEITEDIVNDAITNAGTSDTVILPMENIAEEVKSVQLPVASLEAVADADKGLTVETSNAVITLDAKTLEKIVAEAGTEVNVVLAVDEIKEETLNDKQKNALKDKDVEVVISAQILCNDKVISDFDGGKVKVQIPFTLAEGAKGSDYKVIYIADDGKVEDIATTYVDGCLVIELEHFSEYAIVKNSVAGSVTTSDNAQVWMWIGLLAVALVAVGTNVLLKKRTYETR